MRKIACLILLLADIALSCEVVAMSSHDYPIVEINLFDENKVDMGKVKSVDYGNGLLKEEKTFLAYRADLDTSVYVFALAIPSAINYRLTTPRQHREFIVEKNADNLSKWYGF